MATRKQKAPVTPALVRVYPAAWVLGRQAIDGSFVPGVATDGSDLPPDEAQALLDAGLVTKDKPAAPAPAQEQ